MPLYQNKYKYQLVYPVIGTRVYQTTSLKKGAKKCYEELKSLENINTSYFTVLNIDTYETYKFQIDDKEFVDTNIINPNNSNNTDNTNNTNNSNNSNNLDKNLNNNLDDKSGEILKRIDILQETIDKIDKRVQKIEGHSELKLIEKDASIKLNTDDIIANALSNNINKPSKISEKYKLVTPIEQENFDDQNEACIIM